MLKPRSFLLGAMLLFSTPSFAANYKIDADHSTVGFKVKHLAISSVTGKFTSFEGNFNFEPNQVAESKAQAKISAVSVNTEQKKRDDHLRNPDFLNATKFPEITFKTTKVEPISPTEFKATGDLSIAGVTKSVTLDVQYGGAAKDPWGNERAAFSAVTKINRKDFGLTWNKVLETGGLLVGDDIAINIEIEAVKQS